MLKFIRPLFSLSLKTLAGMAFVLFSLVSLLHAQSPVVALNFDDPSHPLAQTGTSDLSFANNGATFPNGVATFDGSSYLEADNAPFSSAFTINLWMKADSANGYTGDNWYQGAGLVDGEVFGVTDDWGVTLIGDKIAFGIGNGDTTIFSTSSVTTGQWVLVSATWDTSGAMKLYINGTLESSSPFSSSDNRLSDTPFYIGIDANGPTYTGALDNITIYDQVLSGPQISSIYLAAPEPSTPVFLLGMGGMALLLRRRGQA